MKKLFLNIVWHLPWIQEEVKRQLDIVFEKAKVAGSMDAFKKAHADVLETFKDDAEEAAEEIARVKLNSMLSVVDEKAIISVDKRGLIYIGGELAPDERLSALKSEAEFFIQSELWKVVCETPRKLAEREMFVSGDSIDAMKKGRAMLYLLSQQENIIKTLKSWEKKTAINT